MAWLVEVSESGADRRILQVGGGDEVEAGPGLVLVERDGALLLVTGGQAVAVVSPGGAPVGTGDGAVALAVGTAVLVGETQLRVRAEVGPGPASENAVGPAPGDGTSGRQ